MYVVTHLFPNMEWGHWETDVYGPFDTSEEAEAFMEAQTEEPNNPHGGWTATYLLAPESVND